MLGRKVAIAGKSDRRTAVSTGIGVPRDCVKSQKKSPQCERAKRVTHKNE